MGYDSEYRIQDAQTDTARPVTCNTYQLDEFRDFRTTTFPSHPPIPQSSVPTLEDTDRLLLDPKGWTFMAIPFQKLNNIAVKNLFLDLPIWSCVTRGNDQAPMVVSSAALYLTATTTSYEADALPANDAPPPVEDTQKGEDDSADPVTAADPINVPKPTEPAKPEAVPPAAVPKETKLPQSPGGNVGVAPNGPVDLGKEPAAAPQAGGSGGNPAGSGNQAPQGQGAVPGTPNQAGASPQGQGGAPGSPNQAGASPQGQGSGANPNGGNQGNGNNIGELIMGGFGPSNAGGQPKGDGPPPPPAPQNLAFTLGSETIAANPAGAFVVAGQTLSPGGVINPSGTPISLDSNAAFVAIGGSTQQLTGTSPTPPPSITLGDRIIEANPQGQFIVDGQTLNAGGAAITVSGTPISIASNTAFAVVGGSTQQIANAAGAAGVAPQPTSPPSFTFGDKTVQANPQGQFIIDGQTLTPGGTLVISGTPISLPKTGDFVVVGTSTVPLSHDLAQSSGPGVGAATFSIGDKLVTVNPEGKWVVDGQTLAPGSGGQYVVGGKTATVDGNGVFEVDGQVLTALPGSGSGAGTGSASPTGTAGGDGDGDGEGSGAAAFEGVANVGAAFSVLLVEGAIGSWMLLWWMAR